MSSEQQETPLDIHPITDAPVEIAFTTQSDTDTTGGNAGRLRLLAPIARLGDLIEFELQARPWPDPKLTAVKVEVLYRSTRLWMREDTPSTLVGQLTTPDGPIADEEGSNGTEGDITVVARGMLRAEDLAPAGRVRGVVRLPAGHPPTSTRIVTWQATAAFERRRALDRHDVAALTVHGPIADPARPVAATGGAGPDDWLLRVREASGTFAERLAPSLRQPCVELALATPAAAPGGRLGGEVTVIAGDALLEDISARNRRKASERGEVELTTVVATLECWRGSPVRESCQRLLKVEYPLTKKLILQFGETCRLPLTIEVPQQAPITTHYYDNHVRGPVPETYRPPPAIAEVLDELRWRVVVDAVVAHAMISQSRLQSQTWAAREVIVTAPV